MNLLAEKSGRVYCALVIDAACDFVSPFPGVLFPCMIWDHDGRCTADQRGRIASALLEAGCRYAVCGGFNCEAWHDAVDWEFFGLHADDSDESRDAVHVMTTWHENENPDDVAFFFVRNTNFDHHDFERYLVLHLGGSGKEEEINAAVRRYALNDDAV